MSGVELDGGEDGLTGWGSWGSSHSNWGSGISSRGNSSQSRGSSIGGSSIVVRSICREGRGCSVGVVESISISRPLDLSSSIVGLKEACLGSSNLRGVSYGKGSNSIVDRGSRGKSTVDVLVTIG